MTPYENFTKEYEHFKKYYKGDYSNFVLDYEVEVSKAKYHYISALEGAITILQERQTFFTDTFQKTEHTMAGLMANTYKTDIEKLKEQIELINNHN